MKFTQDSFVSCQTTAEGPQLYKLCTVYYFHNLQSKALKLLNTYFKPLTFKLWLIITSVQNFIEKHNRLCFQKNIYFGMDYFHQTQFLTVNYQKIGSVFCCLLGNRSFEKIFSSVYKNNFSHIQFCNLFLTCQCIIWLVVLLIIVLRENLVHSNNQTYGLICNINNRRVLKRFFLLKQMTFCIPLATLNS